MDTEGKIAIAKEKKDVGDQAFKNGEVVNALRSYHEALMYLNGITKNVQSAMARENEGDVVDKSAEEKPKTEADEILEKIYSNMAACHIKNGNWRRALETADKALAKNPKNSKALFRKAKALGEQGYFEKAEAILTELTKEDSADGPIILAELTRLRAADKVREKEQNKKFKGFLNRDKGAKSAGEKSNS
ncbi:hypothetical protein BDY19DRAFT_934685 [Irpex rosettiformis]|uniref:Uncharacterized protein n=1 Tax=Irpex rosettiformis TaxID=378272 RepID=A0ACB8UB96_9APHY|nr:hypothetical protein BDY19DRAFT_934685 [Irpex rosettiformis]